jgi:hypothetical protein
VVRLSQTFISVSRFSALPRSCGDAGDYEPFASAGHDARHCVDGGNPVVVSMNIGSGRNSGRLYPTQYLSGESSGVYDMVRHRRGTRPTEQRLATM